jgi:FMN phosphatase YigB (HAD superfamily)
VRPKIDLLVCDLDNTLYDWVTFCSVASYLMVDVASRLLEVPVKRLLNELPAVVRRRQHESEQSLALLQTESVRRAFPGATAKELVEALNDAFQAFNSARKEHLKAYPAVRETLRNIQRRGTRIVVHTEATVINAQCQLSWLKLSEFFSHLYVVEHTEEGHPCPESLLPLENAERVRAIFLPGRKPDKKILEEICFIEETLPDRTVYLGDSIARDIAMANAAGVHSVWAKYGTRYADEHSQRLVQIGHWTSEDVGRARKDSTMCDSCVPEVVLETFAELVDHFDFVSMPTPDPDVMELPW